MPVLIRSTQAPGLEGAELDWSAVITWDDTPDRDAVRTAMRTVDADGVVVCGDVGTLHRVVEGLHRAGAVAQTPIGYVPGDVHPIFAPLGDPRSRLQVALHGPPQEMLLIRDEAGGVVLDRAELWPAEGRTLGAQAYHDDQRICNGKIRSITAVPDYTASDPTLMVTVRFAGLRRPRRTTGRSVQIASDEAITVVDGIRSERPYSKRTWYGDRRTHWLLRR